MSLLDVYYIWRQNDERKQTKEKRSSELQKVFPVEAPSQFESDDF